MLDLVGSLVDQSLVQVEVEEAGTTRYRLLETLRRYAQQRLAERSEVGSVIRRHAAHYLALAETAEPELTGPQQMAWLDRLERGYDNLRAALSRSLAEGNVGIAAQLCGALGRFWYERSYLNEGIHWLDALLSTPRALPEPVRATVLMWAGMLRAKQGDYVRAQGELEQSLALWQRLGDQQSIALILNILGSTARYQGDFERTTALCERAMAMAQQVGDRWITALCLYQLGYVAQHQGRLKEATVLHEQSLDLFREVGDQRRLAAALANLAGLALQRGDSERALAFYREGLELAWTVKEGFRIAETLEGLGDVASALREPARAARLCGAAQAVREAIDFPLPPVERRAHECRLDAIRSVLDGAAFEAAWAEGWALAATDWEPAFAYALEKEPPASLGPWGSRWSPNGPEHGLSPRQIEVAVLVARGLTNREIGAELVITPGTAANHVQHILSKLGYHSRKQIASWAVEHGLYPKK